MKHLIAASLIALLAGCAAAPKPVMTEDQYVQFATTLAHTRACGVSGMIPADTASLGMSYVAGAINSYSYDQQRMSGYASYYSRQAPTAQTCNELAMAIMTRKRQVASHNAAVAADSKGWNDMVNSTRPQAPIYCNQAGTQTVCN